MIIETLGNGTPFIIGEGLATKLQGETLPEITEEAANEICYCDFECKYVETVFADVGKEWWKNDKNSWLFKKWIAADSIVLKLYKDDEHITTIIDDTLGDYYNGFATQPLYVGFCIHWENVMNTYGPGFYQLKAEITILGSDSTWESRLFQLMPYDDIMADGTVRFECYQTGNILASDFDYTDLIEGGWYQSYRIKGMFGFKEPQLNTDNYRDQNYKIKQIQDSIKNFYQLKTDLLPAEIIRMMTQDNLLANKILLTDYNILNTEIFRRIELYPDEIPEVTNYERNRNQKIILKFTDKIDNIIKTNF